MAYDPNNVPPIAPRDPVYTGTVVESGSNTGWWIAGGLGAAILIAVVWIVTSGGPEDDTEALLAQSRADVIAAQALADQTVLQSQMAGAQQSVDMARMDAARAQSEAVRATSEARAETARAAAQPPVIITVPAAPTSTLEPSSDPDGEAPVTTTSPQP